MGIQNVGRWTMTQRQQKKVPRTMYLRILITILQKPLPPPPPANFKSTPLAIFVGAGRGGKTGTIFEDHIFLMCPSLPSPPPPPTLSFQHKKLY
ncbi:MAG: hypothetical protein ACK53Y_27475 [bacterium]